MDFSVNSGFLYAVTALVVVFVLAQSAFFLLKAARRARQLGITGQTIRKTVLSSALFSVAPAVAILLRGHHPVEVPGPAPALAAAERAGRADL